ncbi:MAG: NAD(P)H-dependent oxidoreductase [Nitrospiraceae bacterium]|nr:NAD(P)H-dependent oxidoreductase [Nitrospiraceae bacterium]
MSKHITIIQGNPDGSVRHFGHALADEYANGARDGGHEVRRIDVAAMNFPILRTKAEFEEGVPPDAIRHAQDDVRWADHLVIVYPLWLGSMPALLKAFFEQLLRPGFAFEHQQSGASPKKLMTGKSARIVVTMGMPAILYQWFFLAHSLRSFKRNILEFVGFAPVKSTVIGNIETLTEAQRMAWLDTLRSLGRAGR